MQLTALVLIVCFVIIDHESVVLKSEFEEFLQNVPKLKQNASDIQLSLTLTSN